MNKPCKKLRVGVIGAGFVAQRAHLDCYKCLSNCELVGVAELRPALRNRIAEKYNLPIAVETHHELIARDNVDAVIVVTRRHATGPIVLDALGAGKHVLSEKPMAHTSIQAQQLLNAAQAARSVYQIGFMKRHDPHVRFAKRYLSRLLESGNAGRPVMIRCYSRSGNDGQDTSDLIMTDEPRPDGIVLWRPGPEWLDDAWLSEYDKFLNIHVHIVNLSRHLIDMPLTIRGFKLHSDGTSSADGSFDHIPCLFEFSDSQSTKWLEGIEVHFEMGLLRLQLQPPFSVDEPAALIWIDKKGIAHTLSPGIPHKWQFLAQAEEFINRAVMESPDSSSADDSVFDLIAIETMWRQVGYSN